MITIFSRKRITLLQISVAIVTLLASWFIECYVGVELCHLCWVQRIIILILSVLFLLQIIFSSIDWLFNIWIVLFLLIGLSLDIHHITLIYQPHQDAQCLPDLFYLLSTFSVWETVTMVLNDPSSCGQVTFTFLGLNIPEWLVGFYCVQILLTFIRFRLPIDTQDQG